MAILDDAKQLFPDVSEQDLVDDLTGLKQQMPAAGDPELLKTLDTEYKKLKPQLYQQAMKPSVSEQDVSSLYDEAINRAREQVGNRTLRGLGQAIASSARGESVQPTYEKELAQAKQEQLGRSDAILKARQAEPSDAARRIGIIEGAEQKQATVEKQQKMSDPKSGESKQRQDWLLSHIRGLNEQTVRGMSAEMLDKYIPQEVQLKLAEEAAADRRLREQERRDESKVKAEDRQRQLDEKTFIDSVDTLQGLKRGSNAGVFGMASKRTTLANDGLRLIQQIRSGEVIPSPQVVVELSRNLDSLLSASGQASVEITRELTAKTGKRTLADAIQFITSNPQDSISQQMLKNLEHQIIGQRDYWKHQRDKVMGGQASKLEGVFKRQPELEERFNRIIEATWNEEQPTEQPKNTAPLNEQEKKRLEELRSKYRGPR